MKIFKNVALATLIAGVVSVSFSYAQSTHSHGHSGPSAAIGSPGGTPSRTVNIVMYDNYYEPENVSIAHGETIKFVVKNAGDFVHEFNVNTPDQHTAHGPRMAMLFEMGMIEPDKIKRAEMAATKGSDHDMSHDAPNSLLLEPGETQELVWTFNTNLDLEFACNVPGHYDAGMAGIFDIAH